MALLPTLYSHYLQFVSLFTLTDVSKYEIRNQEVYEDYISRLNTTLDCLIFNSRAKMKLAMLAFLYCIGIVKKVYCLVFEFFSRRHRIVINGNIGITGFTTRKQKISNSKIVSQWALNSGFQPFGSNALLSELLRQVLLGMSLNCLFFLQSSLGLRSFSENQRNMTMQRS